MHAYHITELALFTFLLTFGPSWANRAIRRGKIRAEGMNRAERDILAHLHMHQGDERVLGPTMAITNASIQPTLPARLLFNSISGTNVNACFCYPQP